MPNNKTKEVTKSETRVPIPKGEEIPGLENITPEMIILPRLKLIQKMSDEVNAPYNYKPGSIVNSATKDLISKVDSKLKKPTVTIIPILNNITRIFFAPLGESRGMYCRSNDGKGEFGEGEPGGKCKFCPKNEWIRTGTDQKPPVCTEFWNFFCIVRGYELPIPLVASFYRTSMKAGQQLIQFMKLHSEKARLSPWYFAYNLITEIEKSGDFVYHVFKVIPGGESTEQEAALGTDLYKMIKTSKTDIHWDEEEIKREQERMEQEDKGGEPGQQEVKFKDDTVPF